MITIFDILPIAGFIFGAIFFAQYGQQHFGVSGGAVGLLLGGAAGFAIGKATWFLTWRIANIEGKSDKELRGILDSDKYFIYHLALAVLMSRGENIDQYKKKLIALLSAQEHDRRLFGWRALGFAFPELARQCPDYNPGDSVSECREKAKRFESVNKISDNEKQPIDGSSKST